MIISSMRSNAKVQDPDQQNNDEDVEYSPTKEERMHANLDDVSLTHPRSTMQRPQHGRQVPLIRSSSGHSTHVMSSGTFYITY